MSVLLTDACDTFPWNFQRIRRPRAFHSTRTIRWKRSTLGDPRGGKCQLPGTQSADAYWDYADYLHSNPQSVSGAKGREAQNAELDKLASLDGQKHNLDAGKLQACIKAQDEKGCARL